MSLATASSTLQQRLDELRAKYDVPGASLAVLEGDDVTTVASGVLNLDTGVEATVDSLFQIGSITKVWTTTVIMQLVDEGLVELDAHINDDAFCEAALQVFDAWVANGSVPAGRPA